MSSKTTDVVHDDAPVHFFRNEREHLTLTFQDRWIDWGGPTSWPVRSSNLNPLDFWLSRTTRQINMAISFMFTLLDGRYSDLVWSLDFLSLVHQVAVGLSTVRNSRVSSPFPKISKTELSFTSGTLVRKLQNKMTTKRGHVFTEDKLIEICTYLEASLREIYTNNPRRLN
ncbi:hypothetical protein ANN_14831 [Periplaneta americana]|uniref:Uncharacterized protein n=1 Tax=Periplaneta americana TaxID=6978 RepID=A0ABQ8SY02_PERAM|nr:hypothetical protein ANN_14831 [Periplaneta americana]